MKSAAARHVIRATSWLVAATGVVSGAAVGVAVWSLPTLPQRAGLQVAIFAGVATLPQYLVDLVARAAESIAKGQLPPNVPLERGFANLGAWVGVVERPLLLGALVGGFPAFIAGWYVLKGVAGYRLGLDRQQVAERRVFQLFLINNGTSFAGVAVGWLLWRLLGLPILTP